MRPFPTQTSHYVNGSADVVQTLLKKVSSSKDLSQPTLPCSTPHNLTFQIGGKPFSVSPQDFVIQSDSSTCVANVEDISAPSNGSLFSWSLGQPFLRSNLVVFYYGNFSHPSFDPPPRMGFVSLVGPGAVKLNGAASMYGFVYVSWYEIAFLSVSVALLLVV